MYFNYKDHTIMIILTFIRIITKKKRKKLLLNISSSITFISKITQYLFVPFYSIDKFNHETDRLKRLLEHNIKPLILMCRDLGKKREFMGREGDAWPLNDFNVIFDPVGEFREIPPTARTLPFREDFLREGSVSGPNLLLRLSSS